MISLGESSAIVQVGTYDVKEGHLKLTETLRI